MDDHKMLLIRFFLLAIVFPSCHPIDFITIDDSLADGNTLVSQNGTFALGFFSPGNSKHRYLGIWYHKLPQQTVVWVANRNSPVNDSSGVLTMRNDGNLVVSHRQSCIWSTNVSVERTDGYVAQLLDSGNFVLIHNGSNQIVWQSFDHPTDTMLPGLKIGLDLKLGLYKSLTSWRSENDPGAGEWYYKLDPNGCPQFFLHKGSTRIWRCNPWPWDPAPMPGYLPASAFNQDEIFYTFLVESEVLSRIVIKNTGIIQRLTWDNSSSQWRVSRLEPKYIYGHCGAYSVLNSNNLDSLECTCLPGYEPKLLKNWYLRDGSAGCVRKRREITSVCGNGEGFFKVEQVKIPDTSIATVLNRSLSIVECREMCLKNCSCRAFASMDIERKDYGCLMWFGELMDTVEYTEGRGFFVRVDATELAEEARKRGSFLKRNVWLAIPALSSVLNLLLVVIFANWWRKRKWKRKAKKKLSEGLFSTLMANSLEECSHPSDVPFFDLSVVNMATNHFSAENKLGQGGFGPVFKGQLKDGRYIAVKRLCQSSGQGIEEFKNEVLLLTRLQHRNLVKLLGCCIEGDEQMLIYEFLPNKSLDYFIFDHKTLALDWRKRFDIILGIARGILYLHHDSRLRIIHRDLKSSNVLLDAEMNPKISDFGIARICNRDEFHDRTKRVMGTHGYMAPEYALFGKFSTKSDVFSFGVILLEIISGKKCNNLFPDDPSLHLIGHVWCLWMQGRAREIIDSSMTDSEDFPRVLRCIQIGLLCVQKSEMDRPAMSAVILMLNSERTLPCPGEPAFISARNGKDANYSLNHVTITQFEAR